jgi:glutathione S-transferase
LTSFYYFPGSCSLASHIALEEAGIAYTAVKVDLYKGEQHMPGYRAINPLGRVPALSTDDGLLTENLAILNHVADGVPDRHLLPAWGTIGRVRALEMLSFLASTVHPTFRTVTRPERFLEGPASPAIDEVRRRGISNLTEILNILEGRLEGRDYTLGPEYSLCDAYLLVFASWAREDALRAVLPPMPRLDALAERVEHRPAVRRVLAREAA